MVVEEQGRLVIGLQAANAQKNRPEPLDLEVYVLLQIRGNLEGTEWCISGAAVRVLLISDVELPDIDPLLTATPCGCGIDGSNAPYLSEVVAQSRKGPDLGTLLRPPVS